MYIHWFKILDMALIKSLLLLRRSKDNLYSEDNNTVVFVRYPSFLVFFSADETLTTVQVKSVEDLYNSRYSHSYFSHSYSDRSIENDSNRTKTKIA
jgi:hypothetical protein